jgi:hypothetical protein
MQHYLDNNRDFISGELILQTGNISREIIGTSHSFEEISLAEEPSICTGYFIAREVVDGEVIEEPLP